MIRIDQAAYSSPWYSFHPAVKLGLVAASLLLVLALDTEIISISVLLSMSLLVILAARVSWRFYLNLMLIPLCFLVAGCAAVAVTNSIQPHGLWPAVYAGGLWWGISDGSWHQAQALMLRCLACVSAMYLLALTTPVVQLVYVMRMLKIPDVITDLTGLIYINIFTFLQTAQDIYIAQQSRCGYRGFKGQFSSLSALVSNLFLKNLHRTSACYDGLLARGFNGSLEVLEEPYIFKPVHLAAVSIFISSLLMIYFYGGRYAA